MPGQAPQPKPHSLHVGQIVEVDDATYFLPAVIREITDTTVKVHFLGWENQYDRTIKIAELPDKLHENKEFTKSLTPYQETLFKKQHKVGDKIKVSYFSSADDYVQKWVDAEIIAKNDSGLKIKACFRKKMIKEQILWRELPYRVSPATLVAVDIADMDLYQEHSGGYIRGTHVAHVIQELDNNFALIEYWEKDAGWTLKEVNKRHLQKQKANKDNEVIHHDEFKAGSPVIVISKSDGKAKHGIFVSKDENYTTLVLDGEKKTVKVAPETHQVVLDSDALANPFKAPLTPEDILALEKPESKLLQQIQLNPSWLTHIVQYQDIQIILQLVSKLIQLKQFNALIPLLRLDPRLKVKNEEVDSRLKDLAKDILPAHFPNPLEVLRLLLMREETDSLYYEDIELIITETLSVLIQEKPTAIDARILVECLSVRDAEEESSLIYSLMSNSSLATMTLVLNYLTMCVEDNIKLPEHFIHNVKQLLQVMKEEPETSLTTLKYFLAAYGFLNTLKLPNDAAVTLGKIKFHFERLLQKGLVDDGITAYALLDKKLQAELLTDIIEKKPGKAAPYIKKHVETLETQEERVRLVQLLQKYGDKLAAGLSKETRQSLIDEIQEATELDPLELILFKIHLNIVRLQDFEELALTRDTAVELLEKRLANGRSVLEHFDETRADNDAEECIIYLVSLILEEEPAPVAAGDAIQAEAPDANQQLKLDAESLYNQLSQTSVFTVPTFKAKILKPIFMVTGEERFKDELVEIGIDALDNDNLTEAEKLSLLEDMPESVQYSVTKACIDKGWRGLTLELLKDVLLLVCSSIQDKAIFFNYVSCCREILRERIPYSPQKRADFIDPVLEQRQDITPLEKAKCRRSLFPMAASLTVQDMLLTAAEMHKLLQVELTDNQRMIIQGILASRNTCIYIEHLLTWINQHKFDANMKLIFELIINEFEAVEKYAADKCLTVAATTVFTLVKIAAVAAEQNKAAYSGFLIRALIVMNHAFKKGVNNYTQADREERKDLLKKYLPLCTDEDKKKFIDDVFASLYRSSTPMHELFFDVLNVAEIDQADKLAIAEYIMLKLLQGNNLDYKHEEFKQLLEYIHEHSMLTDDIVDAILHRRDDALKVCFLGYSLIKKICKGKPQDIPKKTIERLSNIFIEHDPIGKDGICYTSFKYDSSDLIFLCSLIPTENEFVKEIIRYFHSVHPIGSLGRFALKALLDYHECCEFKPVTQEVRRGILLPERILIGYFLKGNNYKHSRFFAKRAINHHAAFRQHFASYVNTLINHALKDNPFSKPSLITELKKSLKLGVPSKDYAKRLRMFACLMTVPSNTSLDNRVSLLEHLGLLLSELLKVSDCQNGQSPAGQELALLFVCIKKTTGQSVEDLALLVTEKLSTSCYQPATNNTSMPSAPPLEEDEEEHKEDEQGDSYEKKYPVLAKSFAG